MKIFENLDKANLHHAYLIEGARDSVVPHILDLIKSFGIEVENNPDFTHIAIDNFKMDEAMSLREMGSQMAFTTNKKFFIVSANTFSLDAQQALLKMFEEPIENTHFFVVVPEIDAMIKTLRSRFFVISPKMVIDKDLVAQAEQFIKMPLFKRIDFIKELLADADDEDGDTVALNSARSKALKFLNALESILHQNMSKGTFDITKDTGYFEQIFKARQFLRQPGSATKTLMESVALRLPVLL